jgi:PKD repeat protein
MRLILLFAFTLSINISGNSQTFQKTFSASSQTLFYPYVSISETRDSNIVLAYAYNNGFRLDTFSRLGNYISGSSFQETTTSTFLYSGAKDVANGRKVIYGTTDYPASVYNNVIYQIDSAGIIEWSSYIVNNVFGGNYIGDVYASPSGSIYVAGKGTYSNTVSGITFAKYSSTGQELFAKIYTYEMQSQSSDYTHERIFSVGDSVLYIINTGDTWLGEQSVYVSKADTLGDILWTKLIYTNSFRKLAAKSVVVTDTSMYISGYAEDGPLGGNDIFVLNLRFNGEINWLKYYGSSYNDCAYSSCLTSDNKLIIGGSTNYLDTQRVAYCIMAVDLQGNELFAKRRFTGSSSAYTDKIVELQASENSSGFYAVGQQLHNNSSPSFYFESDRSNGLSGCGETLFSFDELNEIPETRSIISTGFSTSSGVPYNYSRTSVPSNLTSVLCTTTCNINSGFVMANDTICYGDTLRGYAQDTSLLQYSWSIDDSLVGTYDSITLYLNPGQHKLKLVVTDSSCIDSTVHFIHVRQAPVAQFSSFRQYHLLSLTNRSIDADYYQWKLSDGAVSTVNFFKHDFRDTGYVYIELDVRGECGVDTAYTRIYVNDSIGANFTKAYYGFSAQTLGDFSDIALCADGGVVAVGQGVGTGYSLSKTDIIGKIQWSSYTPSSSCPATCVAPSYDFGFLCGASYGNRINIMKFDSLGNNQWIKYTSGTLPTMTGIAELPNHDIIATGERFGGSYSYVICLDEFGTVKWFEDIPLNKPNGILIRNNSIYIYGWRSGKPSLIKMNSNGIIMWHNDYVNTYAGGVFYNADFMGGNKIVLISNIYGNIWGLCIDTSGAAVWSKRYMIINNNSGSYNVTCIGNNTIEITVRGSQGHYYAYELDSNGNYINNIGYQWNTHYLPIYKTLTNYEGQLISLGAPFDSLLYCLGKRDMNASNSCYQSDSDPAFSAEPVMVNPQVLPISSLPPPVLAIYIAYPIYLHDTGYCEVYHNCNTQASFNYSYVNGALDFVSTSSGPVISYLWDFGDGFYSTAAHPQHYYSSSGIYTVCLSVTSSFCTDSICQAINVVTTGEANEDLLFDIYPNPANDKLNIRFSEATSGVISLCDVQGKILLDQTIKNSQAAVLDVSQLAPGIYFINVVSESGTNHWEKIVINK